MYSVLNPILVAQHRYHGVRLVFFDVHFALLRLLELASGNFLDDVELTTLNSKEGPGGIVSDDVTIGQLP